MGYTGATNADYYNHWKISAATSGVTNVLTGQEINVEGALGMLASIAPGSPNVITISHPNYAETDVDTSGAQVIDTMTISNGHVTAFTTRDLTPIDIGAQASGSYDNYNNWKLSADNDAEGVGHLITSGVAVRFTGGTGISTSRTADVLTLTNDSPNVTTNLGVSTSATTVTVTSSDGTNAVLPGAVAGSGRRPGTGRAFLGPNGRSCDPVACADYR